MADRTGQQIGSYHLLRLLGKGGFAEVYLAQHQHLDTLVAIKLLHTHVADSDMDIFLQEARILGRLIHPHIVRVFDFGVSDGVPFLIMDYAPNGTLRRQHPRGSQISPETVVRYVKQIADALYYAHNEHLIHRDIKPENLLVGRRNEIVLSDFGIALLAQSSRLQSTQNVAGTVVYMAPEQFQGKPRPASDQYSLGIVIYEWLSGTLPFHGSFAEIASQHLFMLPPSLSERVPGIAPELEQVIMTAIAKDPKQRFANIQAFAHALEQASQNPVRPSITPTLLPSIQTPADEREDIPAVQPPGLPATRPASTLQIQQPYLDKVVFRSSDNTRTIADLRSGSITSSWLLDLDQLNTYKALQHYTLVTNPKSANYELIEFNFKNPLLGTDQALRKAISMAINRDNLIQVSRKGEALPLCTDHGSVYNPGYQADAPCPKFDPEAAKSLLDQDGWTVGSDGIRTKAGKSL